MATVDVAKLMEGMVFADDAQKAAFEAILANPTNAETASRRYLRREEGSRLAAETAAAKAQVEEEKRLSANHMAAMNEWQASREAELKTEAQAEVTRFKTELKAKGIDPDSLLGQNLQNQNLQNQGLQTPPPTYGKAEMSKDFVNLSTAQALATTALDLPMEMARLQAERRELFGDAPVDWAAIGDKAKANIISGRFQTVRDAVNATAEEVWKVSEVRETKKTETLRAQIEGEMKSKYEDLLAKANLPGMNSPVYVDPNENVFSKEFAEKTKIGGGGEDPHFQEAKDDFLRVNAELESAGVPMLR